jgi:hypothetical protein
MSDPKTEIVLTITVTEKNGKPHILVSGAPAHEMPIVRSGLFADRHRLLDEVWVEIKKRKPQIVKVKSEKPAVKKPTSIAKDELKSDQLVDEATEQIADEAPAADDGAPESGEDDDTPIATGVRSDEPLPPIEGDTIPEVTHG